MYLHTYILTYILLYTFYYIETRKHIDLESHWSKPYRPTITYHRNENLYEEQFMKLLEKYPCPDDYVQNADISAGGPVVKEF